MTPTASQSDIRNGSCVPDFSFPWYAIRTKSNCEKLVGNALESKGYEAFVPTYQVRRRWTDRVVDAVVPLFPGYLFCRFDAKQRVPIVSTPGVVSVVGFAHEPAPVGEVEIEAVKALLRSGLAIETCGFLREGQRVRIDRGALQGVEGILLKKKTEYRFIVSVPLLQRSVAVEIDPHWITPA